MINSAFAEVYGGIGLDYGFPHSGIERSHGSILIGNRINGLAYFYGGELDFGTSLDSTSDYTTIRGRVLVGRNFGNLNPFAGVGSTIYIDNGTNYVGPNISGGIETKVGEKTFLRFETIRDFNPDHLTPITVIRMGILLSY